MLLLELRPKFHAQSQCGDTLLHAAVGQQLSDSIRFLVEQGLDLNARGDLCETPLILACSLGHGEIAKLLLELGADPNLKDSRGELPKMEFED